MFYCPANYRKVTRAAMCEVLRELEVDSDHDVKIPIKAVTTDVLVLPGQINNLVDV